MINRLSFRFLNKEASTYLTNLSEFKISLLYDVVFLVLFSFSCDR